MFLFDALARPEREGRVTRLSKEDQARVLTFVTEEHRPVRAVAAEMGCTPAAIYALLGRVRRERAAEPPPAEQQPLALDATTEAPSATSLPAVIEWVAPPPAKPAPTTLEPTTLEPATPQPTTLQPAAPTLVQAVPPPREEAAPLADRPLGARLSKPGMGLVTRSADGDESVLPFRSLDDLLSAIKPILREGARSPEPVWFSLRAIDLAGIEADAA